MSRYLLVKKLEEIYPGNGDEPAEGRELKFVIFDEEGHYDKYKEGIMYNHKGQDYNTLTDIDIDDLYWSEYQQIDVSTTIKEITKDEYNEYKRIIREYDNIWIK